MFFRTPKRKSVDNQIDGQNSGESSHDTTRFGTDPENMIPAAKRQRNRYGFQNESIARGHAFAPALKPSLSEEEKKILGKILNLLNMKFDEFNEKLRDLKIGLPNFLNKIKTEIQLNRLPSPKQEDLFLQALINRRFLHPTMLEKRNAKKPEHKSDFHPSPFSAMKFMPRGMGR